MRLAPGIILFSALGITAVCSAEEVDLSYQQIFKL